MKYECDCGAIYESLAAMDACFRDNHGIPLPITADMYKDVLNFMCKFDIEYDGPPRRLPADLAKFRINFMQEELDEYKEAHWNEDLEGQFDALIDLVYVALGTAIFQGLPWYPGWIEVQKTNMEKRRPKSGEGVRHTKDIVKPDGWVPPNLTEIIVQHIKEKVKC